MTDRENIRLYFEDIAVRNQDIRHDRTKNLIKERRFFQLESVQQINSGQQDLMSWTLVLEGHEGNLHDNRGDFLTAQNNLAFMVLKHVKPDDLPARRAGYDKAFEIGMEICAKIRVDCEDPCNAMTGPGVKVPFAIQKPKVKYHEVGLPLFINAIGYRFIIDLFSDKNVTLAMNPAKWNLS